jgi:hypothetical protein
MNQVLNDLAIIAGVTLFFAKWPAALQGRPLMRRARMLWSAVATAAYLIILAPVIAGGVDEEASPIFEVKLPTGYRDWQMVSVAHEAGSLNDFRAILGNDIAIKAYRDGTRPFPDGAIIARLAWKYVSSDENNAIFGQAQSFVPGAATNTQFSVKDSKRYADTGGWGYGQFEDGKPNRSEALMKTCFACHARGNKADDFVFTHYTP